MGFFVLAPTFELGNMPNYWACMSCQVLLASAAFDAYFDDKEKSFWLIRIQDSYFLTISSPLVKGKLALECVAFSRGGFFGFYIFLLMNKRWFS